MEGLLSVRYPPYAGKLAKFRQTAELKPNFDRSGKEVKGLGYWLSFVLTLGGDSTKGVFSRWFLAVLFAMGAKRYADSGSLPNYLR
jgi:beta-apo-4'-carotenal oxygenase